MTYNHDENFPPDPELDRLEPGIQALAEYLLRNPQSNASEYKIQILQMGFSDEDFARIHPRALGRVIKWSSK
jgi:hypothetical protein